MVIITEEWVSLEAPFPSLSPSSYVRVIANFAIKDQFPLYVTGPHLFHPA